MPRVVLTHKCNRPGCEGDPGDILDLTEDLASYLLKRKGATLVRDVRAKPAKDAEDGDSENDEEPPGGSAGTGSATDAGGPSGGPQESARAARKRNRKGPKKESDETTSGDGSPADAEDGDPTETE